MKEEKDLFIDVERDSYIDGIIVANSRSTYIDVDLFISEEFDSTPITNNPERIDEFITEYGITPEEAVAIQRVGDALADLITLRVKLGNFIVV